MKIIILFILIIISINANNILYKNNNYRYYGGLSEGTLNLPDSVMKTQSTVITKEVFSANNKQEIEKAVLKQKLEQVDNALDAKDFIMDKTGHLFGGLSEGKLKF